MRKMLILGFAATLAVLTLGLTSGSANAATQTGKATFTITEPAGAFSQWDNVWTHVYTVDVQGDGTFTGTGVINGNDGTNLFTDEPETVTGKLNADGTLDIVGTRTNDGVRWSLINAITDGVSVNRGTLLNPNDPSYLLEFKVTAPVFATVAPPVPALGNHGDCVSGATHAGIKGKPLAEIAKVVTKVGAYGSPTCPAVTS